MISILDLLKQLGPDAAKALLTAAFLRAGAKPELLAVILELAPDVVKFFVELLEDHAAGAPLPDIARAPFIDDGKLIDDEAARVAAAAKGSA